MAKYRLSDEDFDFLTRAINRIDPTTLDGCKFIDGWISQIALTETNRHELATMPGILDVVSRSRVPGVRIFYIKTVRGSTSIVSRPCNLIPVE